MVYSEVNRRGIDLDAALQAEALERLGLGGEGELKELLDLFSGGHHVLFTARTLELKIVKADPAGDKFIECAVALKAEVIVPGDKALRRIGSFMGIKILDPGDFLRLIEPKPGV